MPISVSELPFNPRRVTRVFVSFSGGKDPTASLVQVLRLFHPAQVTALFADTGAEAPETYEYLRMFSRVVFPVKRLAQRVVGEGEQKRILECIELSWNEAAGARGALTLLDEIRIRARRRPDAAGWPSPAHRYCTKALKVQVINKYIRDVTDPAQRRYCLSVLGIRRAESAARADTPAFEFNYDLGVPVWYPVVDWSTEDVLSYLRKWGIPLNPVYNRAGRANCAVYFFNGDREVIAHERAYPGLLDPYIEVEREIGYTWKPGRSLETLQAIARGDIPDQISLFGGESEGLSCMSGFCDV